MPRSSASSKDPKQTRARVRAYLASLPLESRRIINKMRAAVLAAAPGATEKISYGFPVFKLDGEPVVWCAAWKKHTSIYPITPAVRRALATEIKAYEVAKGTIRFPLAKPPSVAFVKRLVRARIAELRKGSKS